MLRKHFLLMLLITIILFLTGAALVFAPSAGWWEYLLGCASVLLALGSFGFFCLLPPTTIPAGVGGTRHP